MFSKECTRCLFKQANILKCDEQTDVWTDNGELHPDVSLDTQVTHKEFNAQTDKTILQ